MQKKKKKGENFFVFLVSKLINLKLYISYSFSKLFAVVNSSDGTPKQCISNHFAVHIPGFAAAAVAAVSEIAEGLVYR